MKPAPGPLFTAILKKEDDLYVAHCRELDIASQARSIEEALDNVKEAVQLFLETADLREIQERQRGHDEPSP